MSKVFIIGFEPDMIKFKVIPKIINPTLENILSYGIEVCDPYTKTAKGAFFVYNHYDECTEGYVLNTETSELFEVSKNIILGITDFEYSEVSKGFLK